MFIVINKIDDPNFINGIKTGITVNVITNTFTNYMSL